jgi:hypothetical protein
MRRTLSTLLLLSLVSIAALADGLQPRTIYVFKNGLGFVVEEGALTPREGVVEVDAPDALFGTLWVRAGGRTDAIDRVVAHPVDVEEMRAARTLADLLEANTGHVATLTVGTHEITGRLLPAPKSTDNAEDSDHTIRPPASSLVLVESDGQVHAFNRSEVTSVAFRDKPSTSLSEPQQKKRLSILLRDRAAAQNVSLAYLRRDITWTPEYELKLVDETKGQLTMQAVLVDDALDLHGTDVLFVVGVPSFAFDRVRSPLSLRESLAEFFSSLSRRHYDEANAMSNIVSQSAMVNVSSSTVLGPTTTELGGSGEEDLFLYRQPDVTLRKGERGAYRVFTASVPLRHIYRWDIPDDAPYDSAQSFARTERDREQQHERVWHLVRLTNTTPVPWTTAPALVVSDEKPLAGNTLDYTAKGANVDLRLTAATDIAVDRQDLEAGRQPNARTFSGSSYDAVTVEGTLRVRSFKESDVTLSVTKMVTGEVVAASDQGKSIKLATARSAVNPVSKINWEIPLKGGEKKTITYRYRVYVRG